MILTQYVGIAYPPDWGGVLETAPNPCWVSDLMPMLIKMLSFDIWSQL